MLIAHTSDIHIGAEAFERTPLEDAFYSVMEEISEKCAEMGVKYLIVSGDLFDVDKPPYDVVLRGVSALKSLRERGVRVIVVAGNHDNSRRKDGILNVLSEAGLINLLDYTEEAGWLMLYPRAFNDDRIVFYGIPGFRGTGSREVEYVRRGLIKFKDLSIYSSYRVIVLAHLSMKFAGYDPSRYYWRYGKLYLDREDILRRLPTNTAYVALGHIHIPIPMESSFRGNIAYPGAPIGIDSNDLKETYELSKIGISRRILLLDLNYQPPEVKAIKLDSVPKVFYASIETKSVEDVKNYIRTVLNEMGDVRYGALVIKVSGLDKLNGELESYRTEIMKRNNIYVNIRVRSPEEQETVPQSFLDESPTRSQEELSLPDIELNVLREVATSRKIPLSVEKLKWLIHRLSRSESLTPEKLLGEIIKELGDQLDG